MRRLSDEDARYFAERAERWGPRFYTCATRGCEEPTMFRVGYRYVTGRAGRVSDAERNACDRHAQAFAAKYGVVIPAEVTGRYERPMGVVSDV